MSFFQRIFGGDGPRVPVDTTPAGDELEQVVAELQDLGRQIDALRDKRRALKVREAVLIAKRNTPVNATVAGQNLSGEV